MEGSTEKIFPNTPTTTSIASGTSGYSQKTKRGFSSLFGGNTVTETVVGKKARTNQANKPEKVTLVIEMARLPALLVEIDKCKTIAELKVSDIFKKPVNKLKN